MWIGLFITVFVVVYMYGLDRYVWQGVKTAFPKFSSQARVRNIYFGTSYFYILNLLIFRLFNTDWMPSPIKLFIGLSAIIIYFCKTFMGGVLLLEDVFRIPSLIFRALKPSPVAQTESSREKITRSEFLAKSALLVGTVPLGLISQGIISGAYDYQIINKKIVLPNLPKSFEGLKIAQISDIHCGQLVQNQAIKRGIELLLAQRPDLIFFTGDLVNYDTSEAQPFIQTLQKIKAPLGVFSILGNHDYGDYRSWANEKEKSDNLLKMRQLHQFLGWQLLENTHHFLKINQEKIALLGVGNWGARGRFPKYGKLAKAYQGTEEASVKLLLSHDPTHWDAQVRDYQLIDVTFSGHTHGMQMGIEWGNLRFSPAQLLFEQWGGWYEKGSQSIYVNRGFGFSEIFPARVGILPEITIFELRKV